MRAFHIVTDTGFNKSQIPQTLLTSFNWLQQIQNSLARAVVKAPESTHMGHSHEMSDNRSPGDIFLYIPQVDEC